MAYEEIYRIVELVRNHNKWRRKECINLIASENVTSPLVDMLYMNDGMHRYAEGLPWKRYYQGTRYIDEIEEKTNQALGELFEAKFVDIRPVSGTSANGAAFYSLGERNSIALVAPVYAGSHVSHTKFGILGALGIVETELPFNHEEMKVDVDRSIKEIKNKKPKIVIVGGSLILFRQPVKELREAANEVGSYIIYDAAHVLGLIAGKQFQDPLKEGADLVTSSTHKTFPGPQGGVAMTNNQEVFKKFRKVIFPVFVSNHHLHRLAATWATALEMKYFGEQYAKDIIRNAKALAEELHARGFKVLGEKYGFTETHQVALDVRNLGGGAYVAALLENCNIITNKNMIPGDTPDKVREPSGLRLGVQEMTRYGCGVSEMKYIAELMEKALIKKANPEEIKLEVIQFRKSFQEVKYTFDINIESLTEAKLPILI
jgi:glycine hydroxymethyltransferase